MTKYELVYALLQLGDETVDLFKPDTILTAFSDTILSHTLNRINDGHEFVPAACDIPTGAELVAIIDKASSVDQFFDLFNAYCIQHPSVLTEDLTDDKAYELGKQAWAEPMPEEMKAWPLYDGCDDITIHVPPGILADENLLNAYCAGAQDARPDVDEELSIW
jgi:hypothetical protein